METDDFALAFGVGGHGDYGRHRDDPAALALLEVSRVQPEIGPFAGERSVEEGTDAVVDLLAQLANGALADPGQPCAALPPASQAEPLAAPPIACTRSSTRRVETPLTQASWITATNAFSEVFRGSRKGGK